MAISVSQGKIKSHKLKFFKSRYLVEFFRLGPKILHVIITFVGFKITLSNLGPKTTPSLISKGGIRYPPPGREGNRHPLGNRVNICPCSISPQVMEWGKKRANDMKIFIARMVEAICNNQNI